MSATSRKRPPVRVREPHLLGLILVATLVIVAGVVSIGETDNAWLVALVVGVMLALAAVLALEVGAAIDGDEEADDPA
jgi:Mg/Co/Ni transporter MgtE